LFTFFVICHPRAALANPKYTATKRIDLSWR
jgi:hypothetical protein